MFVLLSPQRTGIEFANAIHENDSINILDLPNIYNGGGVGIGDFNNDGLMDVYFTGNDVSNKLYINKGDFHFDDVTQVSGTSGEGRWCRGVSVVDINNDGLQDLYVCATLMKDPRRRENILYINTGSDKDHTPHFENMAQEYGLADTSHSTMAAFFDYDNDGDLDMYLLNNEILHGQNPAAFRPIFKNGEHPNTDKLFRNDWNASLHHPVFTDVSKQAGITIEGYGHSVNIVDINRDGWKDIYVANDFISNDLLYINNHDGTFKDEVTTYFKHTSENAMGMDIMDVNNDGLVDVVELDMNPEDNYRKKMMMNAISYQRYLNNEEYGYQYQYVRNTLQINQGPRVLQNDSIGAPIFSDISFYAGMAETDWSWTPSVIDFDNDGYRDILITNGFPKDVTDHDFGAFRSKAYNLAPKKDILEQIPQVKISNYAYRNNGDLTFKDVTKEWGMYLPSFSNGAAYVDLDNDGDLDYVVNNIDDKAFVYKNNSRDLNKSNYLEIKFAGDSLNKNGLGAFVELHYKRTQQVFENTPYRGYLSSVTPIAHFGLGSATSIDSIVIKWPGGQMQLIQNVKANQLLTVDINNAQLGYTPATPAIDTGSLFTEITSNVNVDYLQKERDYIDFNVQKLLPHKFSEYGPGLACGDIDGNGLDDIVCGGSFFFDTQIFLQQPRGKFIRRSLQGRADSLPDKGNEDLGILLFDADGDGDLDLYITSGGYEMKPNTDAFRDRFYVNDGKGDFHRDSLAIPSNFTSKFCVRACDFDKDGDLDLFVAGRVKPWNYPRPVSSFIYRNDSKNGAIKFTDVTSSIAPALIDLGLVCDGLWTDFDNDGWQDLILAGEWMPIKFLKNVNGQFKDITSSTGSDKKLGWWNSITAGDFDNDGDMDYVVGNLGTNSFYKASDQYPVSVYAKDFDGNGVMECIPTRFIKDEDGKPEEFTAHVRDDVIDQMPFIKKRFLSYKDFANANFGKLFTNDQMNGAIKLKANDFSSSLIRNNGNGGFSIEALPAIAQTSIINGMITEDFDGDGNLDILIAGNDYGTDISTGRYDASNGIFLKGDGKGNFTALSILQSGWFVPGNCKAIIRLRNVNNELIVAAGQNRGALKIYKLNKSIKCFSLNKDDASVTVRYKKGITQKRETDYGSSFLSQSGRFVLMNNTIASIEIKNSLGVVRKINF
ncbi:MAG TPA: VCBS repeat-containing protein [Chitinophagaceae bacterium]|jgi:hypothetical protein|nr:VCBS repeat-containing protein [Chitinophagaceae bacterium]